MATTTDLIVKFVELVENNPCLYNNTLSQYSRKDITERAWSSIAAEMQWPVADCKEKWRNMRSDFLRSLREPPSGSSVKGKKQYYLHDIMQFLVPYVKPVQHTEGNNSNIVLRAEDILTDAADIQVCNEENFTEPADAYIEPHNPVKKRKKPADGDDKVADGVLQLVKAKRQKN